MKHFISGFTVMIIMITTVLFSSCVPKAQQTIAVYKVEKSGVTPESAKRLLQLLPMDKAILEAGNYIDRNGRISIIDTKNYFSLPLEIIGEEGGDEDDQPVLAEALNFEGLKATKTIRPAVAEEIFMAALDRTDLLPAGGKASSRNNWLIIENERENSISKTAINTRVTYNIRVDDIPVEGPGAKISASFYGEGLINRLRYANRNLSRGEMVPLLDANEVKERCKNMYNQLELRDIEIKTRLFYYAPPLCQKEVHTLIPYYECSGTAIIDGQRIFLLQYSIPAIDDVKYVPAIYIKARMKGNKVVATAEIEGGSPPYRIRWSSPSFGVEEGEKEMKYSLFQRSKQKYENLKLEVIDNNGVFVQTIQHIEFSEIVFAEIVEIFPFEDGIREYGTENSVFNQFGGLEQGFINKMNSDGVKKRFNWRGLDAWEQDFKGPEDNQWIDNTDITFYVGHGNVGYFTFENNSHDDSTLDNNDATGDWGDKDLEWLALYSCKVMGKGSDGKEPFRNWNQEFNGLHLLLGFHTNAQANNQFSGAFASNMVNANMTVLQAWFDAIDDHQPNDRIGIVMGVFRKDDGVWNYNDHFHGKGPVGPDIRSNRIGARWYVSGP